MKTLNKIWGLGLLAFLLLLSAPSKSIAQEGYISDQTFYDELQPYGTWVSDPEYGNVWVPDAEEGFRPYATRGHWVLTDYGNTWVSDYPWGWITFHYGRWRYDEYYGWEWIPGHEWAPAWVSWRHGGGYYGWAPLMPGISIDISFGFGYDVPDYYWVCVPQAYITNPFIYNYYVPYHRTVIIINNTTIINNTYVRNNVTYIGGPRVDEIRRATHSRNIRVYNINDAGRPGRESISNNRVNIYRPQVQRSHDARPARVVDAGAYRDRHPNERIADRRTGAAGYNRSNAVKLSRTARDNRPDNKVVHVNPPDNAERMRQQQEQQRRQQEQRRPQVKPQQQPPTRQPQQPVQPQVQQPQQPVQPKVQPRQQPPARQGQQPPRQPQQPVQPQVKPQQPARPQVQPQQRPQQQPARQPQQPVQPQVKPPQQPARQPQQPHQQQPSRQERQRPQQQPARPQVQPQQPRPQQQPPARQPQQPKQQPPAKREPPQSQ